MGDTYFFSRLLYFKKTLVFFIRFLIKNLIIVECSELLNSRKTISKLRRGVVHARSLKRLLNQILKSLKERRRNWQGKCL